MVDLDAIRAHVSSALQQEEIFSLTLRELGIDSLEFLELIMDVEQKFGVELKMEELDPDMSIDCFCRKFASPADL